jgi:hypothetical protein
MDYDHFLHYSLHIFSGCVGGYVVGCGGGCVSGDAINGRLYPVYS